MVSKIVRYIGLAEEASFNEDPPPASIIHLDITSIGLDSPDDPELVYESALSRGVSLHRPGFYAPEGEISYAFDISTVTYLMKWCLGGYAFTEGVDPALNTHEIWGVEDVRLPSFCARAGKDVFEHVFSGCIVSSLTLSVEDEFTELSAEIASAVDSSDTLKAVTDLILPDEYPLAFHEVTANLNSSDISPTVMSAEVSIENGADAEAGRGLGSRYPYRVPVGAREVTIDVDLLFENQDNQERFWGGAGGPADTGAAEFQFGLDFDAGADGDMNLNFPRCVFQSLETQPDGREEITQSATIKAYLDTHTLEDGTTEVSSEVLATITNGTAEVAPTP